MSELSAAELATRLGLTEKWLRNQRWLGKGPPFVRREGRVFYPLRGVKLYEKRRARGRKA